MERVPDQLQPWLCIFRDNYFDDVEAEKNVGIVEQAKPGESAARDAFLFLSTHCLDGPAEIFSCARFHFDEDKRVVVAADDVDLAATVPAEITVKNFVAFFAQKTDGQFFAERTPPKMFRPK